MADSRRFGGGDEIKLRLQRHLQDRKESVEIQFKRFKTLVSLIKDRASRGLVSLKTLRTALATLFGGLRRRFVQIPTDKLEREERECVLFLSLPDRPSNFLELFLSESPRVSSLGEVEPSDLTDPDDDDTSTANESMDSKKSSEFELIDMGEFSDNEDTDSIVIPELMADDEKCLTALRKVVWKAEDQGCISRVQASVLSQVLNTMALPLPGVRSDQQDSEESTKTVKNSGNGDHHVEIDDAKYALESLPGSSNVICIWRGTADGGEISLDCEMTEGIAITVKIHWETRTNLLHAVHVSLLDRSGSVGYADVELLNSWLRSLRLENIRQTNVASLIELVTWLFDVLQGPGDYSQEMKSVQRKKRQPIRKYRNALLSKKVAGMPPEDLDFLSTRKRCDVAKLREVTLMDLEEAVRSQFVGIYEKYRKDAQRYNTQRVANLKAAKAKAAKSKKGKAVVRTPQPSRMAWKRIVHLEAVCRKEAIDSFNQTVDGFEKCYYEDSTTSEQEIELPQLAFHGTRNRMNMDSICESGLVPPGEFTKEGYLVNVSTGSLFGEGIYTSRDPRTAEAYGAYDYTTGASQFFVGLVLPGRPWYCVTDSGYQSHLPKKYPRVRWGQTQMKGFHSHVHADRKSFDVTVVFKSSQFLPLFLVTLVNDRLPTRIDASLNNLTPLIAHDSHLQEIDEDKDQEGKRKLCLSKTSIKAKKGNEKMRSNPKVPPSKPGLVIKKMPGLETTWSLSLSRPILRKLEQREYMYNRILYSDGRLPSANDQLNDQLRLSMSDLAGQQGVNVVFAIDKSQSMGQGFRRLALPACGQLYRTLQPDWARAVLFGETVESLVVSNVQFFSNRGPAAKTKLEPATALTQGIEKAVEIILKRHDDLRQKEDRKLRESLVEIELKLSALREEKKKLEQLFEDRGSYQKESKSVLRTRAQTKRIESEVRCAMDAVQIASTNLMGVRGPRRTKLLKQMFNATKKLNEAMRKRTVLVRAAFNKLQPRKNKPSEKEDKTGLAALSSNAEAKILGTDHLATADATTIVEAVKKVNKKISRNLSHHQRQMLRTLGSTSRNLESFSWDQEKFITENSSELFVLVILSDGVETIASKMKTDAMLQKAYKMLQPSGIRLMVKLVGIGRYADTELMVRIKLATQTVSLWELTPVHYARKRKSLPVVVEKLASELRVNACGQPLRVEAISSMGITEGLLANLADKHPRSCINVRLRSDDKSTLILFRGKVPPSHLHLDNKCVKLYLPDSEDAGGWDPNAPKWRGRPFFSEGKDVEEKESDSKKHQSLRALASPQQPSGDDIARWLLALRDGVTALKLRAVAREDEGTLMTTLKVIKKLTKGIKTFGFDPMWLRELDPGKRSEVMRDKRRVTHDIEALTNGLEDMVRLANTMTSDQMATWLNRVSSYKYGAKALRLAEQVSSIDVAMDLKWRARKETMERGVDNAGNVNELDELDGSSRPGGDRGSTGRLLGAHAEEIAKKTAATNSLTMTKTSSSLAVADSNAHINNQRTSPVGEGNENDEGFDWVKAKEMYQHRQRLDASFKSFLDNATATECWDEIYKSQQIQKVTKEVEDLEESAKIIETKKKQQSITHYRFEANTPVVVHMPKPGALSKWHKQKGTLVKKVTGVLNTWIVKMESNGKCLELPISNLKRIIEREKIDSVVSKFSAFEEKAHKRKMVHLQAQLTALDLLCSYGMLGKLIQVRRSQASVIDPWALIVSYVSPDMATTHSACCALDAGLPLKDEKGNKAHDVLVICNPRNPRPYLRFVGSKLHKLYQSLLYTRTLDVMLPSQRTALLMVALCKSIEQLVPSPKMPGRSRSPSPSNAVRNKRGSRRGSRKGSASSRLSTPAGSPKALARGVRGAKDVGNEGGDPGEDLVHNSERHQAIETVFHILYTLRLHLRASLLQNQNNGKAGDRKSSNPYWTSMIEKLSGSDPGKHLTEAKGDDINSVVKPLATLCCFEEGLALFARSETHTNTSEHQTQGTNGKKIHMASKAAKLGLALLAEAASREARVFVKSKLPKSVPDRKTSLKKPKKKADTKSSKENDFKIDAAQGLSTSDAAAHGILIRALGVDIKSTVPGVTKLGQKDIPADKAELSGAYDESKALRHAQRFFAKGWTNCNVHTVMAVLTFLQALADYDWDNDNDEDSDPDRNTNSNNDIQSKESNIERLKRLDALLQSGDPFRLYNFVSQRLADAKIGRFVRNLAPGVNARAIQTGLFAQGVFAHASAKRKHGLPELSDPTNVVGDIAKELRRREYSAKLLEKAKRMSAEMERVRNANRRVRLKVEQEQFLSTHVGLPEVFGIGQIEELALELKLKHDKDQETNGRNDEGLHDTDRGNAQHKRSTENCDSKSKNEEKKGKDSNRENKRSPVSCWVPPSLTKSGMLRHRCGWKTCPDYLKCFATKDDLLHGTRFGLFRHLKPLLHPKRLYVGGLHIVGQSFYRRHRNNKEAFIRGMVTYYLSKRASSEGGDQRIKDAKRDAELLWDGFAKR
mmetsp:Transcript_19174/g.47013  ORF Transcript_19174/g.47013 Transcript_19174/m.47013 type:complete len:2489 (+) Transcript_19174:82-7548(+)